MLLVEAEEAGGRRGRGALGTGTANGLAAKAQPPFLSCPPLLPPSRVGAGRGAGGVWGCGAALGGGQAPGLGGGGQGSELSSGAGPRALEAGRPRLTPPRHRLHQPPSAQAWLRFVGEHEA